MLRLSNRVRLGAALLFGCSTPALAQFSSTPENVSENVVVTASHLAGGTSARDPNVTVLDAAQIAARQPVSITALLGDLPGVYMQQAGGRGSVVSLFARGAQPNFTLVLLDGVKANDPTNTRGGSYDFSTLSLHDIERVEMVQGPASAIYGSDALGGVINIITRKGTPDLQAGLSAEGGGFGYWRAGGHVSGPVGGARANLGLAFEDSGMPVAGGNVRGLSLDGALALPRIAGTDVSFNGRFGSSKATSFPDSSGGPRLAVLRVLDHRDTDEGVLGAHAVRAMAANWNMLLDYGLYTRSSDTRSPGVAPSAQTPFGIPANTDKARFTRNQLTWTNRFQLDEKLDIAAGLDLQIEHGVDDGTLDFGFPLPTRFALNRTLWAAFAETQVALTDQLTLSASGRYDNNGGDGHFSPHLRADYALADTGTRFQVSWGKAFKLPSFYALGNPIVGDPALRPERAETIQGGISQTLWGWGNWKLEAYDTDYTDLIDFQPGAVPKLVNRSSVHVRGLETQLAITLGDVTATPHASYTSARDQLTGAAMRDVPHWLAGGTLTWRPITDAAFSLDVSHVGALIDNAVPTGDVRLGSHVQADVAASYRLLPNLTVKASVENVLNARYESVVGFRAPGTLVRAGLSASL